MNNIKWINNDPQRGIDYDWDAIAAMYNALGIPDNVYNPTRTHDLSSGKYIVDMSERSTGKTTNWLLLGMCMHELYETQIIYIRERSDMIMPKHSKQLFTTILEYNYVDQITGGKYNNIRYSSRAFYYWNTTTGEVSETPFMLCLGIDENMLNKSSFNAPRGDLIIFDEFISKYNYSMLFVDFMDTLKTVIRERYSPLIVMCANTINKHSFWFKELGIYDEVQHLKINQRRQFTNAGGTVIDLAYMGRRVEDMPPEKRRHNTMFFGFENSLLNSIRGGEWAIKLYQHITGEPDTVEHLRNIYLKHNGYYMSLRLCYNNRYGYHVEVVPASNPHDDTIIICTDVQTINRQHYYKWLPGNLGRVYAELYDRNLYFYATNYEGELLENYMLENKLL